MHNIYNAPLKHCPFCGSVARRTGGTVGSITITSCRCSNSDCIASFKSVDYEVWNTRAKKRVANATTTLQWKDGPYGFEESK